MTKPEFVTSADGTRIAFEWSGQGDTKLIYVHGAGSDRTANAALKSILGKHFRVLSYDRRGRGDSGDAQTYTFETEVEDLRSVISEIGGPVTVFGSSMGARVALELLRIPPKLTDMVLFEPPATDVADADYAEKIGRCQALIASGDRDGALVLHNRLIHGRTDDEIAAMRSKTDDWQVRLDNVHVTLREMRAIHCEALFAAKSYEKPNFPAHLLVGDQTLPFIRKSAELIDNLEFVSRTELPGKKHSALRTHPDEIAEVVLPLLRAKHPGT